MFLQLRNPKLYLLITLDALIFILSITLAFLIRFEFHLDSDAIGHIHNIIPYAVFFKIGVYYIFSLYKGMWRFTDVRDLWNILLASTFSSLVVISIPLYLHRFEGYSRSIFILDWIITTLATGGLRVFIRTIYLYKGNFSGVSPVTFRAFRRRSANTRQVIVIGAGHEGEKILRDILESQEIDYDVVGFLDDDVSKRFRSIHGVPVLGTSGELSSVLRKYAIDMVLITSMDASGDKLRKIIDVCKKIQVSYKTLPMISEIINGKISIKDLRDIRYEDLLGRKPVNLDMDSIRSVLKDKVILVTGAGGSIGSALCRQIIRFEPQLLIMLDASESSLYLIQMEIHHEHYFSRYKTVLGRIQDKPLMERIFSEYKPDLVFHAAAYKHVPMLEHHPWEAVLNNILGTKILMEVAEMHGVERFVFVSTDKAVRPTSIMGATKRVAEILIQSRRGQGTMFLAVRFGNVVGSSGSVIPLFQRQIALGGPVTVTHPEVTRYFMTIQEAAQLILQAGSLGEGSEIFILEMGVPVKIADMARDLIRLTGKEPDRDIKIVFTGLRPGEKLYEELITSGEGIVETQHEKIMVLRPDGSQSGPEALEVQLENLFEAARSQNEAAIRTMLKNLVPEFIGPPRNPV